MDFLNLNAFQIAYIVDLAVVLYALIMTLRDAKKGFVFCVFGLLISVVSLVVAFFCASTVLEMTSGLFGLQETICGKIEETLLGIAGFDADVTQEGLTAALAAANLPEFMIGLISDIGIEAPAGTTLAAHFGVTIGEFASLVLTGIILFVLCKIVLTLVEKVFTSLVEKVSLLAAVNGILGAAVGFVKAAIFVLLILAAIALIPSPDIAAFMEETLFIGKLYLNNPVNYLFSLIFVG